MKGFKDIEIKLCHSCGTCAGVCPRGSIAIVNGKPRLIGECDFCGLCYKSCPGMEFLFPEFNKSIFGESPSDKELGYYRSIYAGHASDERIRKAGASGGVVSALLLGLLRRGRIGGAVVVGMDDKFPWLPKVRVAASEKEIIAAAQSKYTMVSVNEVLPSLEKLEEEAAFVGLPCHIHGLRKLQAQKWKPSLKVKYSIGIFCGFNMAPSATDFLIGKFKVKKEDIRSLEYRSGEWPGGFLLTTKAGCRYFIEKHVYNYLNLMWTPKRCLACPDLTNEFSDISVGDAWDKDLGEKGWSSIIVRTASGDELLKGALEEKDIIIKESGKESIKKGHSQVIAYKKKGVFFRQDALDIKPKFDLAAPALNKKERTFNFVLFCIISFMRTAFARAIFKFIPIGLPGLTGKYARSAINLVFRPRKKRSADNKKEGIFDKFSLELKYLGLKDWTFSEVGAHWDSIEDYDDINKETHSYFRRFTDGYRFSDLPKNSYVLDICARTGNGTLFFWQKGLVKKAVCADFSKRMQCVCGELLEKKGVCFDKRLVETLPLPFKEAEFDVVLCFESIEHVPAPDILIRELARCLKSGGQMIMTTPNHLWRIVHSVAAVFDLHHSEGPCRFIKHQKMRKYLKDAGFEIMKERTTILIPAGPKFLIKAGEYLEERIWKGLMDILGLRQIYVCRKR